MTTSQKIIILILLVAALALAGFIAKEVWFKEPVETSNRNILDVIPPREAPDNPNLTEEEKALFVNPPSAKSNEQLRNSMEGVASAATEVSEIVFNGCIPDPVVVRVKHGSTLTLRNAGGESVLIKLEKKEYTIEAGKTRETHVLLAGNDVTAQKSIGYSCNDEGKVGFIYVSY
jgi:hypothetical protein